MKLPGWKSILRKMIVDEEWLTECDEMNEWHAEHRGMENEANLPTRADTKGGINRCKWKWSKWKFNGKSRDASCFKSEQIEEKKQKCYKTDATLMLWFDLLIVRWHTEFQFPNSGVLFSIEVTTSYFSVRSYWRQTTMIELSNIGNEFSGDSLRPVVEQ